MIVLKHIKMESSKKDGINHFGTTISHTLLHRICNFGRGSTQIKKRTSHDVRQRENINPLCTVFSVLALATTHKQNTLGW